MSEITYFAKRSAASPNNDEDAAMATVSIYRGNDLTVARTALIDYMQGEIRWLEKDFKDQWVVDRAAMIRDALPEIEKFTFAPVCKRWETRYVITDGLRWEIIRIERDS